MDATISHDLVALNIWQDHGEPQRVFGVEDPVDLQYKSSMIELMEKSMTTTLDLQESWIIEESEDQGSFFKGVLTGLPLSILLWWAIFWALDWT